MRLFFVQKRKFSGSLWRESKLALARSYATATQASMHLGSGVELRTNPKHSFSPHGPFHSTLTVSPSMSSGIGSSHTRSMTTDQISGTLSVLTVVLFAFLTVVFVVLNFKEKKKMKQEFLYLFRTNRK